MALSLTEIEYLTIHWDDTKPPKKEEEEWYQTGAWVIPSLLIGLM